MSNDDILTDDYVAGLLAQEANDCSLKYSALGMEAFQTKKKPTNIPKPNTRFLRHIIKDTDSHNKALLAKEAAESRARLRDLEYTEEAKRRRANPEPRDIRRRQMGDIQAILGTAPGRSRTSRDDERRRPDSRREENPGRGSKATEAKSQDLIRGRHEDRRRRDRLEGDGYDDKRHGSTREHTRSLRGKDEELSSEDDGHRRGHGRRRRSRSRERRRSLSPREKKSRDSHRHRSRHHSPPQNAKGSLVRPANSETANVDSDPLDDLIGPAPAPVHRGRGRVAQSAGIDRRFSESYDPKNDVEMDDDVGDTWDDAVESFRDWQKLRQNQDDRMRAAGFAEAQIQKAKGSAGEKTEEDVRWAKAGEKREWDVGKADREDPDAPPTLFSMDS